MNDEVDLDLVPIAPSDLDTTTGVDVAEWDAEDFLELVWGTREGWVDMPSKIGRYWVPGPVEWPSAIGHTTRIDSALRDREDIYYSVATFKEKGRNIESIQPTEWLWADLDEVHPTTASRMGLMPTFAIESSRGRYQALWRLDRRLRPIDTEKLNRALTYTLGADKGGWDLTQVLRVPGTRNFKYPEAPFVRLMWYNEDAVYGASTVWRLVREAVPPAELAGAMEVSLPRAPIKRRAKQLLFATSDMVVSGERSARLWELNCLLAEAGLTEAEIFSLVVGTPWNKWAGMGTMKARLTRDIHKAIDHVRRQKRKKELSDRDVVSPPKGVDSDGDGERADGTDTEKALPWVSYASFLDTKIEDPEWLIEGVWTAGSHGIIGGEPKTSKTTIALALALSVASGSPFLGQYEVGNAGPVLFVQEENAPWMMQDRLRKLSWYHELESDADVPLHLLNNWGFNLAVEEHRDMLEAEIAEVRPVFVVLDPLYLMFGGADESRASDLRPFLQWLIRVRFTYGCAVAVVHHMGKQKVGGNVGGYTRSGQRLLGSTTLHGFSDCALYTTKLEDMREGWTKCNIEPEFRSMEPQKSIQLAWHFNKPSEEGMQAEINRFGLEHKIREMVVEMGDGATVSKVARELNMDPRTVLARIRGGELGMEVTGGKRGRHHSWVISLNGHDE